MTQRSSIAKIIAVTSSLTLLVAYVWHSQVIPNTPPPDPLGLSSLELTQASTRSDLRIITSKSISQPIFSVRKIRPSRPWMLPGSKSPVLEFEMDSFYLNLDLPSFDLFGEQLPTKPRP